MALLYVQGGIMKIGDLVKGKKNEILGYVTNNRISYGENWVIVYWLEVELQSIQHVDDLEVLCK
jgi:hypothetical protein